MDALKMDTVEASINLEWEEHVINVMAKVLIGFAVVVGLFSLKEVADYGRHKKSSTSLSVNAKVVWFVQEVPSFAFGFWFYYNNFNAMPTANRFILGYFLIHYVQRSCIYPFLIKGGKPIPLAPFISAIFFTSYNGCLQGLSLSRHNYFSDSHLCTSWFIAGTSIFFIGFFINLHSDYILRNLRKPGETGYKIPKGGAFNFVSAGNYFGEILEWWGVAIAAKLLLPQVAFAFFTTVFLGSRGYHHHRWYLNKMEDYPKKRKAVIPFIF